MKNATVTAVKPSVLSRVDALDMTAVTDAATQIDDLAALAVEQDKQDTADVLKTGEAFKGFKKAMGQSTLVMRGVGFATGATVFSAFMIGGSWLVPILLLGGAVVAGGFAAVHFIDKRADKALIDGLSVMSTAAETNAACHARIAAKLDELAVQPAAAGIDVHAAFKQACKKIANKGQGPWGAYAAPQAGKK